jgi:hypothetical protein
MKRWKPHSGMPVNPDLLKFLFKLCEFDTARITKVHPFGTFVCILICDFLYYLRYLDFDKIGTLISKFYI